MINNKYAIILTIIQVFSCNIMSGSTDVGGGFFTYQMIKIERDEWKVWEEKEPSHYDGDYYGENGAGGMSIHIRAYYDDKQKGIRYAGCIIVAEDVASAPEIAIFKRSKYNAETKNITDGVIYLMPVEIKLSRGKWLKGVVYKSVFYKLN